jgi:hypothetical protein
MKKSFLLLSFLFFGIYFSQINTDEIKKNITENPQKYFYDYLEIFKKDPSKLSQEEVNQLYYGSRFMKLDYNLSVYNKDSKEVWNPASKRGISKSKAQKIVAKAEETYSKYPFDKNILEGLSNIYNALDDKAKSKLFEDQYIAIANTIKKSGTGDSADSPICVIWAGDVISQIDNLRGYGMARDFKQDVKVLPDGSMLTKYEMGKKQIYVKLVGGFR